MSQSKSQANVLSANLQPKHLIIGQGDIGLPVTNRLADLGCAGTGLARGKQEQYDLHPNARFIQADALQLAVADIASFTHITLIVTPDTYSPEAYRKTYFGVAEHISKLAGKHKLPNLKRVVFISSTGVYGQDDGAWIDDTIEPVMPKREGSAFILKAEQVLQSTFGDRATIIRPSGIYGKERLMRIRKVREGSQEPMSLQAWTNRIMDSDLINIIVQVLTLDDAKGIKPIYLATDYLPVTSYELTCWLCDKLEVRQPERSHNHMTTGKRLHSNIPRHWLAYPDWQAGYEAILKSI